MARRDPDDGLVTLEDAAKLDPDAFPADVVDGRLVPVTKGTWRHGRIVAKTVHLLMLYADVHGGWSVATADPGTKLRQHPALLRGPDVGVIQADREPTGRGVHGWLDGAPDLAVEVMGDAATPSQLVRKALEYLAAGGRMVWIVDPDGQEVIVLTPPNAVRIVGRDDMLDAGDVLPGFSCKVAALFE
jgi:Uma2 family endonuclease